MSVIEYRDVIQGTDEWLEQRRGIITASEVGTIITPSTIKPANNMQSRAYAAQIAAERITGWVDPHFVSDDMLRGHDDEPRALDAYSAHFGVDVTVSGFMVRDDWSFKIGYSPDALVGNDGLLEVKSRRPKKHLQTILDDTVPAENVAQCQAALLVSGRAWLDYVSFCGGMPLWVKRVHPDPVWQDALVKAAAEFEKAVDQMVATYRKAVHGLPMTERVLEEEIRF